jgi:uncharacterized protein (DUF1810 family)
MKNLGLDHFVTAHDFMYQTALSELLEGEKKTHWIWFIFPQHFGIGNSPASLYYSIHGLEHAKAYFRHRTLGSNFKKCLAATISNTSSTALQLFGHIDSIKFQSSLTLFRHACLLEKDSRQVDEALDMFFNSEKCSRTLELLKL